MNAYLMEKAPEEVKLTTSKKPLVGSRFFDNDDDAEDDGSNYGVNTQQKSLCSSWKTYDNLGGREVMHDTQAQPGWKGSMNINAQQCADALNCYPLMVMVEGVEVTVKPGVHSFTITSQFARDEFHVALEGPELSPTFVEAHGNGTYTASYCVELPGFYKLYVRILQIDAQISFRKDTFKSPYSVNVQGNTRHPSTNTAEIPVAYASINSTLPHLRKSLVKAPIHLTESPQIRAMDSCTTVRQATQGRWVRFDHAVIYNLLPSSYLQQWEEFLEISRDEYIWIPYSCRLRPMNLDDIRVIFHNLTHCACCDSYIRTLFSATMYALGIFNKDETRDTSHGWFEGESKQLYQKNWEIKGMSMSWHDYKHFKKCLLKGPNGLAVENILANKVNSSQVANHAAMVKNSLGKFVFFVGHPWSGDDRRSKRHNYAIQHAQHAAFTKLGSEIDIFDAFAFTFPRIYHEACDSSHVSCISSERPTLLGVWELLILAQIL
eukprot:CAMPEP_0194298792 /NCGR_PEP_ID=MMETSP0169-20130528/60363_1 /TAXON_ID=218684 /ORGANISM="Corethron pennatum, Strain L29A3" /LENGTH=490 /DNA_ID=CAMNT_0039048817 /DNA_START=111 /DNA_END=1583 /DNA_ORIENTATION=-